MYINKVSLYNFRNYESTEIQFNNDINIIYGNNGEGKTNILEAIYIASYGTSYRTRKDIEFVKIDKPNSKIKVEFYKNKRKQNIECLYDVKTNKKYFKINGVAQNKLSHIYGKINIVIFKPEDINLIKGGPSDRRKYIDQLIGSIKPIYLEILSNYYKILDSRNKFLKENSEVYIKDKNKIDRIQLGVINEQLAKRASDIAKYREEYIKSLEKHTNKIHNSMLDSELNKENIRLNYITDSLNEESFINKLSKNEFKDFVNGYTSTGIQRDDFDINLNGYPVSRYGSQGQQKSTALSIKLSELEIIKNDTGDTPVLLLDDFMSELDDYRQKRFLEIISDKQIILTNTSKISIKGRKNNIYYIENNKITKEEETED